jgi:hypothetical protein
MLLSNAEEEKESLCLTSWLHARERPFQPLPPTAQVRKPSHGYSFLAEKTS